MSKRPFLARCKFVSASVLVIVHGALAAADSGLFSTERTATARQSATNAAGQETKRSIWDGVYTLEQAQRGQTVYKRVCGYCHRDDLSGGGSEDGAPPLIGPPFYYKWRDLTVAEMLVTIAETMPRNAPASLSLKPTLTSAFSSRRTRCRRVMQSYSRTSRRSIRSSSRRTQRQGRRASRARLRPEGGNGTHAVAKKSNARIRTHKKARLVRRCISSAPYVSATPLTLSLSKGERTVILRQAQDDRSPRGVGWAGPDT